MTKAMPTSTRRGGMRETWYSRFGNPTSDVAADEIRQLEGAEAGLMTASGMAAIASTLVTLCRAGERIVAAAELRLANSTRFSTRQALPAK